MKIGAHTREVYVHLVAVEVSYRVLEIRFDVVYLVHSMHTIV